MENELQAEQSAPEVEATVAETPEEVSQPELGEQEEGSPVENESRKFSQDELEAILRKRLDREKRKWERDRQEVRQEAVPAHLNSLSIDQFDSTEEYADALANQKAIKLVQEKEVYLEQKAIQDTFNNREESARDRFDDYDQVVYQNPAFDPVLSTAMAHAIRLSDVGPEIAYYLGQNIKEAERIHRMHPMVQVKEIGKLEDKIGSGSFAKKTTSAPPPIAPVVPKSNGNNYDTTDPRSLKSMSTSEWIDARRKQLTKK